VVLHGNPHVLAALEGDHAGAVMLAESRAHPAGGVGAVGLGLVHVDKAAIGPGGAGFDLAGVPSRGFLGRSFDEALQELVVALGGGLVPAHEGAGLVADPAQDFVDNLGVGSVVGDENELVVAVVDEALGQIVYDAAIGIAGEGEGAGALSELAHVMGGVADGDAGGVEGVGKLGGSLDYAHGGEGIGAEGAVGSVLFVGSHGNEDRVIGLEMLRYFVVAHLGDIQTLRSRHLFLLFALLRERLINVRLLCR